MVRSLVVGLVLLAAPLAAHGQQPTPEQAKTLLQTRPDLVARVRDWIGTSGLTPEQVRARLTAAGYPSSLLDQYLAGGDSTAGLTAPNARTMQALRALGVLGTDDSMPPVDSVPGQPGAPRTDLPAPPKTIEPTIFGLDLFRRVGSQFQPAANGPVDPSYRLGPGDVVVLILTGDVELAHTLEITREGFVVIPQVGQLYVAGLTMGELDTLLYSRLGRVYSGVRRGPGATTRFQATVARLRTNQIYVIGEVAKPGSFQMSSAGTVLTALYLAGGPTATGSFRHVVVRRGKAVVDSLDLYDYLLRGDNTHDLRLESGDVIFVPVRGLQVAVTGAVTRPAIYELKQGESLRDLITAAGGFEATALRRRIQIDRVLPPDQRGVGGRDRVILDIAETQLTDDRAPSVQLSPGDAVKVFSIADRRRNVVTVRGNVWLEGRVGFHSGMRLAEAIRLAGGPKPDVFTGQILISRLNADSSRSQLRSAFRDSTGGVVDDVALQEDDDIQVFSRTTFRPDRWVIVTGAVKHPGRVPFRDGMTLRDAILNADGVSEDAWLKEAEVARLPADRTQGNIATTFRAPLDSTYLFDRGPNGEYHGPPGEPAPARGSPEVVLAPYDNVLIFRQPDWELPRLVSIAGQVRFPGQYVLRTKSERLVDLVARAGGVTKDGYARGAELFRQGVRPKGSELKVVSRLQRGARADSVLADSARTDTTLFTRGLAKRVGLDLPQALERPDGRDNLLMQAGDSIFVPEFDPTVRVLGAVNAPTTIVQRPDWSFDDYVGAAGGYSRKADRGRAFLVQPGGSLESVHKKFLLPDSKPRPGPGAVIFVPERDPADKKDWTSILGSIAQILASALTLVVVATKL